MNPVESLFALRIALVSSRIEARIAESAGVASTTAHSLQASLREQIRAIGVNDIPAQRLRTHAGLTETEEDVLWLLVAAEMAGSVRALLTAASGSSQLSVSMITELVYGDTPSLRAYQELTNGRLRRLELIQRTDGGDETTPAFQRTLRAHPRVVALLLGDTNLAAELEGTATVASRSGSTSSLIMAPACVERARTALSRNDSLVIAVGKRGTGRRSLLEATAQEAGHQVLVVDGARLSTHPDKLATELRGIARESLLNGYTVLLRNLDSLAADAIEVIDTELLPLLATPCLATTTSRLPRPRWNRSVSWIELPDLTGAQREILWTRAIPQAGEGDAEYLASTYPFAPSLIHAVGQALLPLATEIPTADQVIGCINDVVDSRLGSLADRVCTSQSWDDIVLTSDQLDVVRAIIARVRQRSTVYESWGFAAKLSKGLAVTALLSGPPGTGKTMLAGLIAKELGLPLYQVDLSKIVSKWIGETEKHLAALFDAAEAGHAVLLFDEADSLFGKRTEVKSSNDRHANLEVNFLLQRIERYTGICFLTTNHENAVDDAFRRRLAFHLRFSIPDVDERSELWRRMIPSATPLASDIDFATLGRKLAMSGGYIRNAVLRAAFAACDANSPLTMAHLWNAGVAEYEAMGKIAGGL